MKSDLLTFVLIRLHAHVISTVQLILYKLLIQGGLHLCLLKVTKFVPSIILAMLPEDPDTHQLNVKLLLDLHFFQLYECV